MQKEGQGCIFHHELFVVVTIHYSRKIRVGAKLFLEIVVYPLAPHGYRPGKAIGYVLFMSTLNRAT